MRHYSPTFASMVLTSLLIGGCGGGGSSSAGGSTTTGKFVDAAVSGMAYRCGAATTTTGLTSTTGEYTCPTGAAVAFYVGDILIGSVSSAMAVVTPMDLVGSGAGPATPKVANIVRFLMSISSTDPNTGTLTIDPAVATAAAGKTADFVAGGAPLDALITSVRPSATVYTMAQATSHVTSSIQGLFAGTYAGTYTGANSGSWSMTIASNGTVSGTSSGGAVSGTMATTLSTGSTYGYTGTAGTAGSVAWTGSLNISTKVFSGTWDDGAGSTGTFTGTTASSTPTSSTPVLSSFSPTSGATGATVTLTGSNLASVSQVLFTGPSPSTAFVEGTISAKTATGITTTVPSTLAEGSYTVSVVFTGGEAAATGAFSVSTGGTTTTPAPATPVGTQTGGSRQGVAVAMTVSALPSPFNMVSYYSGATVFAGSGTIGNANGAALTAEFNDPSFITTDGSYLYVTDGESVRKISIATGDVSSYTGFFRPNGITTDGVHIYTVNSGGEVQQINIATTTVSTISLTGTAFQGSFNGITVVGDKLYCITGANSSGTSIQVVDVGNTASRGTVTNFVLGDTTAMAGNKLNSSTKTFDSLVDITTDGTHLYVLRSGNIYANPAIDKIVIATGNVSTLAGGGASSDTPVDATLGTNATFKRPRSITTDGLSLFVTDRVTGGGIRTINLQTTAVTGAGVSFGDLSNLGGPKLPTFANAAGITTDGKHVYAVDSRFGSSGSPKILRLQ